MKRWFRLWMAVIMTLSLAACSSEAPEPESAAPESAPSLTVVEEPQTEEVQVPEDFLLITGGTFDMGSPESEAWRSADETQHSVTVSDFYMSAYEVTQQEYEFVMGENPSNFSGENLPVENISWLDAVAYCNARSEQEGLTPAYTVDGTSVSWDRSANGYRLPTEAEWEYACRAGTETPFNTETSISAEESNYWGDYPYMIEDNYFNQGNLETQPGVYRQTTVEVNSFSPNAFGLYNMHGNVGEWVWDYYGEYSTEAQTDPTGPQSGTRRVYRGGGWNDSTRKGVSPAWVSWYNSQNSSYDYKNYDDLSVANRAKGLDCSGFVGWAAYQVMHTSSGQGGGYTVVSGDVGSSYQSRGWGTVYNQNYLSKTGYKLYPGDIGFDSGHTWIVLGQCADKSAVIVHSTPQAGCQISGTTTPDGDYDSQAIQLAQQYMSKFSGFSKYDYHTSCGNYIRRGNYLRWNSSTLSDPNGYKNMTANQILADLFS